MDSLKIYYDEVGKTLTVWFDDPTQEFIAEEIILIKNQSGKVIGVERLNYTPANTETFQVKLLKV